MKKKIIFVTGTRADFGKIKSLIKRTQSNNQFEAKLFVTGMHLYKKYGYTYNEIILSGIKKIHKHKKINNYNKIEKNFSSCYNKFNEFVKKERPDLVVVHGDRVEALACSIATIFHNTLLAHIEGGEVSGSIDESIRHSISKLAQIHFVSNMLSKKRLIQMGEDKNKIYIIGSPETDYLKKLHKYDISKIKEIYNISFNKFSIFIFHSSYNELKNLDKKIKIIIRALKESKKNYIIIFPNNDTGADVILKNIKKLKGNRKFIIFPSIRFEYFINLLKKSEFIIGNSSSGVREAPALGVKSINIGSRQYQRSNAPQITNCNYDVNQILRAIKKINKSENIGKSMSFGTGNSNLKFIKIIKTKDFWKTRTQKVFIDQVV